MYRTGDPRFRRRLDEIGQSLESAGETTKSRLYDFQQLYLNPCLHSVTSCLTTCVEASCPTLNLTSAQRERQRRLQRDGRRGGRRRAELSFDFYDDWDEDENDALMGWDGEENEEFDRLLAGDAGYGTITHTTNVQPGRRRGMSYPKGRRKSAVDVGQPDPTVIPGSSLFGKLFGGKAAALRYKPSAADLQDNPNVRKSGTTEGEALLREGPEGRRGHRRVRSQTATSGHTTDSLSSRGDIFPSDEELEDAIPLDDEFAMVLERRTTREGPETESSSGRTRSTRERGNTNATERGKRPSAGSRRSTRSNAETRKSRSSTFSSNAPVTPTDDAPPAQEYEEQIPPINELKQEERELAEEEEAEVARRREEAERLAAERGLKVDDGSSKEATPNVQTPVLEPVQRTDEISAMTTPLATTDDEAEREDKDDARAGGDHAKS